MKTKSFQYYSCAIALLLAFLFACTPQANGPVDREAANEIPEQVKAAASDPSHPELNSFKPRVSTTPATLPVRFQEPSYVLSDQKELSQSFGMDEDFVVKVGADITSSSGPVVLRDILKKLAGLKKMNISWASDVDQYSYVDVDIRANDDFFKAIDDLLRQRDYFHEVQGNTIVVKFKETKTFRLAMPFTKSTYSSSVGASISDTSKSTVENTGYDFDIWDNIRTNLDQVLNIWEEAASSEPNPTEDPATNNNTTSTKESNDIDKPAKVSRPQSAKGFYTIDKPVGLITVTAPRRIIKKVESYLNNLKGELYKQVSIEAKILEVTISNEKEVGIDWESLLNSSSLGFNMQFGSSTSSQPLGPSSDRSFTMSAKSFNLLISAIEKQGTTKVLSNPKITVLNGQPSLINVGKSVTFIDQVTTTVEGTSVSTSVTTKESTSGIVMSIIATVLDDREVILNLTPVTSQLEEPIEYRDFGSSTVGLPVTNVREMSTIVRVKSGEMLVVGGLIDSSEHGSDDSVPMLSKLPFIGKHLFGLESKIKTKKELVILLKPEII